MRLNLAEIMSSPRGLTYIVKNDKKTVEKKTLYFEEYGPLSERSNEMQLAALLGGLTAKDFAKQITPEYASRTKSDATEDKPYIGDLIQDVVDRYEISNPVWIPDGLEGMLSGLKMHEYQLVPPKGKSVWFPVENGIETTDPFSLAADPANGYVKSVDENGIIEVDVRQIYKRVYGPNIADESRKMQPLSGTAYVDGKYCFENRRDCVDCIISQSYLGYKAPNFYADVIGEKDQTFEDAVARISEGSALEQ